MIEGGIFRNYSPNTRFYLFYCICIWIRLSIAVFVYKFADYKSTIYMVLFASIISIYLNKSKVWWSRDFHLYIAISLLISSILILKGYINKNILSYILVFDVLCGILRSLIIKPFKAFSLDFH